PPSNNGARLIHSMASSIERTCHSQKPAINSLVSANGPSITVRCLPSKRTRTPFELECRPSPISITPAWTSCSLNLPISAKSLALGMPPASDSSLAFTITITRMSILQLSGQGRVHDGDERQGPDSTLIRVRATMNRQLQHGTIAEHPEHHAHHARHHESARPAAASVPAAVLLRGAGRELRDAGVGRVPALRLAAVRRVAESVLLARARD